MVVANRPPGPPTADNPAVLYIAGDSDAGTIGPSLQRLAGKTGVVDSVLDYKVSSGLTRPDFFDWPKHIQKKMAEVGPQIVVMTFGGNDAQPIKVDGKGYDVSAPEWSAEYGRRVGAMMDYLAADGRIAHLGRDPERPVGGPDPPPHRPARRRAGRGGQAARRQAGRRAGRCSPASAAAMPTTSNIDGQFKLVRADDGFHLNQAGADLLAKAINEKVVESLRAMGAQL